MNQNENDLYDELEEDWQEIYAEEDEIEALIAGEILTHYGFSSEYLSEERDIMVYLPPFYHENPKKKYPVVYVNDGNNIFASVPSPMGMEWGIETAFEGLLEDGLMEECIIVGIGNTPARDDEYSPVLDEDEEAGGYADAYLDFLQFELIPFLESEYRIRKGRRFRAFLGSSLGGLVSLYAAFARPELFSQVGAMSPSLWWADRYMEEEYLPELEKTDVRIYLDMGGLEGDDDEECQDGLLDARAVADLLVEMGYTMGKDLIYHEDLDAEHDEVCWGARVHLPLCFFFGLEDQE